MQESNIVPLVLNSQNSFSVKENICTHSYKLRVEQRIPEDALVAEALSLLEYSVLSSTHILESTAFARTGTF